MSNIGDPATNSPTNVARAVALDPAPGAVPWTGRGFDGQDLVPVRQYRRGVRRHDNGLLAALERDRCTAVDVPSARPDRMRRPVDRRRPRARGVTASSCSARRQGGVLSFTVTQPSISRRRRDTRNSSPRRRRHDRDSRRASWPELAGAARRRQRPRTGVSGSRAGSAGCRRRRSPGRLRTHTMTRVAWNGGSSSPSRWLHRASATPGRVGSPSADRRATCSSPAWSASPTWPSATTSSASRLGTARRPTPYWLAAPSSRQP